MAFFPAMRIPAARKIALVRHTLTTLQKHWHLGPMRPHAQSAPTSSSSSYPSPISSSPLQSAIPNPQSAIP
jgi:hypothetical protein